MRGLMTAYVAASALGLFVGLASLSLPALAQEAHGKPHRRAPLRIEVVPTRQLHRECVARYTIEHRATGDTIVPGMHCWWATQ
jgi:hypothetical protein